MLKESSQTSIVSAVVISCNCLMVKISGGRKPKYALATKRAELIFRHASLEKTTAYVYRAAYKS